MGPITSIAIFLTIWWTILFAILPLGTRSYSEMGIEVKDGGDPGAPFEPKLKKKFFTTTWITAVLFALLWCTIKFGWLTLPNIPSNY